MVVMLKQSCCGCTLKTGTLIIAVVFTILAGLQVVMSSFTAMETTEQLYHLQELWEIQEQERLSSTPFPEVDEEGNPVAVNSTDSPYEHRYHIPLATRMKITHISKWCMILESIMGSLSFMLNILLMFAANKDSARHVLIWLFGFFGITCLRLVLELILDGIVFYADVPVGGCVLLSVIIAQTVGAAYSLLVVFSYYRQLVGTAIARRISQQED